MYFCYEPGLEGKYSLLDMMALYDEVIDKNEYEDFDCWIYDMIKSGVFVKEDEDYGK